MVRLTNNFKVYTSFKGNDNTQKFNADLNRVNQQSNLTFKADGHWDRVLKTFLPEVKNEKDKCTNGVKNGFSDAINFVKEIMRQPHKFFSQK